MAKGDKVRVMLDIGNGIAVEQIFEADKAGRSVRFSRDTRTGTVTVEVVGRAGTPARTAELRGDRVVMIEEVPA